MADDNKNPPLPDLESDLEMITPDQPSPPTSPGDPAGPKSASDLEAVFDVPVHVSAVLGRTRMDVGELLKLGPGTVLELDRKVGEAIDIFVNNRLVARGEVVLVKERLGVTMTEIINPELIAAVLAAVAEDSRDLVFRDDSMGNLVKLAAQVAGSEASILITGESGTGKEMLARFVHEKSPRANKPFVSVNCAAIPENLLESELFGHEKGAFTGAVARRIGKFEEATGGTLLLDEISEMETRLQAKLLRALQERVIDRVGGTRPVPVDIRVIATSNRDLIAEAREGRFREDLLYRLNVVNLKLPPLRARPGDILELANHFVRRYAEANNVAARPLSSEARQELMRARWPGNVRELENTIHRAVLLATGDEIGVEAIRLPDGSRMEAGARGPAEQAAAVAGQMATNFVGRTVADVERDLILETLKHCLGNRTHAVKILGVSIRTLRNKLNEYSGDGLAIPAPNGGELRGAA